jgi:hypothetical protein
MRTPATGLENIFMKLIIDAEVKNPFDPSDCTWTDDCYALHEPTGCVFEMDTDGDIYLVGTRGTMPTLRDLVLAAHAAQIFMENVPYVVPHKPRRKPRKKPPGPFTFDWVM